MEKEIIQSKGTVVLPKVVVFTTVSNAFAEEGVAISRLFENILSWRGIKSSLEKEIVCQRVVDSDISKLNVLRSLRDNFMPLDASDIWRIIRLKNKNPETRLRDDGSCNWFLVGDNRGVIWCAKLFKSRHSGWKADLLPEAKFEYGELIFSGQFAK
jgi:hypothetical protein